MFQKETQTETETWLPKRSRVEREGQRSVHEWTSKDGSITEVWYTDDETDVEYISAERASELAKRYELLLSDMVGLDGVGVWSQKGFVEFNQWVRNELYPLLDRIPTDRFRWAKRECRYLMYRNDGTNVRLEQRGEYEKTAIEILEWLKRVVESKVLVSVYDY